MKTKPPKFQEIDEASILHIIQASELGNGIDEAVMELSDSPDRA
jgi:hypothetical protein